MSTWRTDVNDQSKCGTSLGCRNDCNITHLPYTHRNLLNLQERGMTRISYRNFSVSLVQAPGNDIHDFRKDVGKFRVLCISQLK